LSSKFFFEKLEKSKIEYYTLNTYWQLEVQRVNYKFLKKDKEILLSDEMSKAISNGLEGLVLKDIKGLYEVIFILTKAKCETLVKYQIK
jgi:hypothetical protein